MNDPGMMGESSFDKRLTDNVRRIDEKVGYVQDILSEKIDHLRSEVMGNDKRYAERFDAQREANRQRFDAQEVANKYDQEKSNEFRGALEDVGKNKIPRPEAEAMFRSLTEKIDALQARMDRNEGRGSGLDAGWKFLIGAVTLAAALVGIFLAIRR